MIGKLKNIINRLTITDTEDEKSQEILTELFEDVATQTSEAEKQGDDWIYLNDSYRRFLIVSSLPAVMHLLDEEAPLDKIPPHVGSNYKQRKVDTDDSVTEHLQQSSIFRSRHRIRQESDIKNSTSRRCDGRMLRENRTVSRLRETEYVDEAIYFDLRTPSLDELDILTDWVLTELRNEDIGIKPIQFRNEDALETVSPIGSELITHSLRFDVDTASKIVVHFMSTHKEPSEEYISKQYDRLMKYYERNTDGSSNSDGQKE
jgi:hypothetical protein